MIGDVISSCAINIGERLIGDRCEAMKLICLLMMIRRGIVGDNDDGTHVNSTDTGSA
jgi:hypothetical protein